MLKSPEQRGGMFEKKEGEPKKRIVSIEHGGDWVDANYDLLEIPLDLDLAKEKMDYDEWSDNKVGSGKYKTFTEWLKEHGAKDSGIERFNLSP